jgi:hypothetical protein
VLLRTRFTLLPVELAGFYMRVLLSTIFLFITGCTHIVTNDNYSALDTNEVWNVKYTAGKMYGSKSMPSLDILENTFKNDTVKISVIAGYQKTEFIGPLFLPVIPVGDSGILGNLQVKIELDCNACGYEIKELRLSANNESYYPSVKEINPDLPKSYLLNYSIEYVKLDSFQLHFIDLIDSVPSLNLFKKEGEWFMVNVSL